MRQSLKWAIVSGLLCERASPAAVVASSEFALDEDGWDVDREGVLLSVRNGELIARDQSVRDGGHPLWYFVAPDKFVGDRTEAFGGALEFRVGHHEYNAEEGEHQAIGAFDVLLESRAHGISAGVRGLNRGRKVHVIPLDHETWTNTETMHRKAHCPLSRGRSHVATHGSPDVARCIVELRLVRWQVHAARTAPAPVVAVRAEASRRLLRSVPPPPETAVVRIHRLRMLSSAVAVDRRRC